MADPKVKRRKPATTSKATPARRRRRFTTKAVAPRRRTRRRTKGMAEGMAENFSLTNNESTLRQVVTGAVVAFGVKKFFITDDQTKQSKLGVYIAGTVAAIAFKQPGSAVAMGVMALMEYMTPAPLAEGVYFDPSVLNDGDEPLILDADGNVVMMSDGTYYQPSYMPQY